MSGSKNDHGPLVVGGEPRIDFLPTETKMRKENRRQRRSLVALVFMVGVVCVLAVLFFQSIAVASQGALDAERARTQDLLGQQREYAEVRTADSDLKSATDARLVGSATQILWSDIVLEIIDVLPDGTQFHSASAVGMSALDLTPVPEALLQKPRVAQVFLQVDALDLASADAAVLALRKLDSFADLTAYSVTLNTETGFYQLVITLNINEKAFERKYFINPLPDDGSGDTPTDETPTDETPTPTPTSTATPTPTPTNETEG
jgi:hypothetical protein